MTATRQALAELVALKDLKDEELRLRQRRPVRDAQKLAQCNQMQAEYRRRKPLAWAAARAALEVSVEPASTPSPSSGAGSETDAKDGA